MRWLSQYITLTFVLFLAATANAQLTIEITQGQDNPTPIAVVPFAGGNGLSEDVSQVIADNLLRSGQFAPLDRGDMLGNPTKQSDIYYRDWRAVGSEYVVIGRMTNTAGSYKLNYELYDVTAQKQMLAKEVIGNSAQLRDMAHTASDQIFEALTGMRGAFSTKILYVRRNATSAGQYQYGLMMADADGQRETTVLNSREPILSPTWAPNGKEIAYVSFETSRPAIYRHELSSGKRERLTNFKGLNSAPAYSPDGKRLAMVLSKGGSPDIYIMELDSKRLTRVTKHYAIETEPNWTNDGKGILFTSDKGGSPQIYQINLDDNWQERLTFEGAYNARARVLLDGSGIVMVHRPERGGDFHIALQNLQRGTIRTLSDNALDESPTVAPNGSMMLYATKVNGRSILSAVSIDGNTRFNLPSKEGDVREPSWSPFLD
ncbi:Tol-Pal system protein TolB [Sinobacterium norvegicum]|uniref:Tol-Pal system protein TolB n=1 Tax=Sinobacterium norvegicum TaxID=1641715 RepID=A0ABM9AEJ8_9GAMM|nr:Tol-Pal system beta propeller repeat protein TolB [Sinobacterium norvegicum]CAH0991622.1 Tol-Pal system protein TolB [Sinobacterium norvegicum]